MERKEKLLGKTLGELKVVAERVSLPSYAAGQMADWLYKKRVQAVGEMTNISAAKRKALAEIYEIGACSPAQSLASSDGTIKYLFGDDVSGFVESVFIPSEDRATVCVSSQVGCKMNCKFCMTGKQGFSAQLQANGIINQIQSLPEYDRLTNLVFMGMGEPFDNTDELMKVLEILTSPYGYAWSPKRITVSTVGVVPGLKRFLDESHCHLAISLHSPYRVERLSLMPVEKVYPLEKVLALVRQYDFRHQRRVSFEYIMFQGVNDTLEHALALSRLLKGLECRVNLIRFHAIPDVPLRPCNERNMEIFRDALNAYGVTCTVRTSRGEDIFAACGMLSTAKRQQK